MKKLKLISVLLVLAGSLNGCGGGGSGDDDILFVAGLWSGAFTLSENPCNLPGQVQTFTFRHNVNQNEEAVVLQDEANRQFVGNTLKQGFSVDNTGSSQDLGGGVTCNFANRIEYDEVFDDDDNDSLAFLRITRTCSNGTTCELEYQGTAVRGGGVIPSPSPNPSPAPRGACNQMTERSYTGDGGCGLGALALTQGSVGGAAALVLNPFGVNGASSFGIDAADPNTANSTRTDLQITGDVGYSCKIECSPPITFTVSCFKEGGDTCKERY